VHVAELSLVDFRSYATAEVALGPGVTVFVGPNGEGKTNLMEALGYIASQSSHRVASDAPLVRSGTVRAIVRASVVRDERPTLIEIEIAPGKSNRARLNRSPLTRARDALGVLRVVLFAPEDLGLVKGDPSERRRLLDELLVARTPRIAAVRQDYDRVLKQRNALLRSAGGARRGGGADLSTLDVWDAHLARAGGALLAARIGLVADLQPVVASAYAELAPGSGETTASYRCSIGPGPLPPDAEGLTGALLEALVAARTNELERGITLIGPHRDDLLLELAGLPAKGYASHGESWSYALSLKLAAHQLLTADGGEPVLVLDDVFAELDTKRRARLADRVGHAEQVMVTAAVAADVPGALVGVRYDVAGGIVSRAV